MQIRRRLTLAEPAPWCEAVIASPVEAYRERLSQELSAENTLVTAVGSCDGVFEIPYALDVIALDARASDHHGLRTYLRLRARWRSSIIVITAVPNEATATEFLAVGADDAIGEGATWEHLMARLKAATRRARAHNASFRLRVGDIMYSREDRRVWCNSVEVRLAPREMAVFDCLWSHAGSPVSPDLIHEYAWKTRSGTMRARHNRVEVYICSLRRQLSESATVRIETVRGAGYRLTLDTDYRVVAAVG